MNWSNYGKWRHPEQWNKLNNMESTTVDNLTVKDGGSLTISNGVQPPNSFSFYLKNDGQPLIVIDETGFKYKGELVEDAGEVYRLFKEFLIKAK